LKPNSHPLATCSGIILALVTLIITGGNVFWIVKQYMTFSCGYNITIMTVTCVGVILMYVLVLVTTREDASILTSSIAALYCLYLQWTALSSSDDEQCNGNWGSKSNVVWQIVFGLFFTVVSLFTVSASTKKDDETAQAAELGGHLMEKGGEL